MISFENEVYFFQTEYNICTVSAVRLYTYNDQSKSLHLMIRKTHDPHNLYYKSLLTMFENYNTSDRVIEAV